MYKMKKSVKRKCKRTKYNKCKMHHKNKKTHARSQRGGTIEQAYDSEIARCTACNDEHIIDLISYYLILYFVISYLHLYHVS